MSLYKHVMPVFDPEGRSYLLGFYINEWDDDDIIDVTGFHPQTLDEYELLDYERDQVMEYIRENARKILKAINEDNFKEPDYD